MKPLPRLMVAPNGARLTKADHPALPMTEDEVVACAIACHAAGADGIHTHIRDTDGRHLLDAGQYRRLVKVLNDAVPDMAVQITTEAAGLYDPDVQMQVALSSGADLVSAAIREIRRAGRDTAKAFYQDCRAQKIAIQHILYDVADCALLQDTLGAETMADPTLQLLFVLGRYSEMGTSQPEDLAPFLQWLARCGITPDWAVCAFGPHETAVMVHAVAQGGKCRIGFENSLVLSNGQIAQDNAEKVADLVACLKASGDGLSANLVP